MFVTVSYFHASLMQEILEPTRLKSLPNNYSCKKFYRSSYSLSSFWLTVLLNSTNPHGNLAWTHWSKIRKKKFHFRRTNNLIKCCPPLHSIKYEWMPNYFLSFFNEWVSHTFVLEVGRILSQLRTEMLNRMEVASLPVLPNRPGEIPASVATNSSPSDGSFASRRLH